MLVVTIAAPGSVFPQQQPPADTLLNHFTGKWTLRGVIDGKNIQHDITASWVLGHQYLELKETSTEKQPNGLPEYEAVVFICYNTRTNRYDCLWLDNTSNAGLSNGVIAHAAFQPNTIALLFNMSDKTLFHTTFTFSPSENRWHWKMESDEGGRLQTFADAQMFQKQ